jgi:hypothetical protein
MPQIVLPSSVRSALERLRTTLVEQRTFRKRWREHVAAQKKAKKS